MAGEGATDGTAPPSDQKKAAPSDQKKPPASGEEKASTPARYGTGLPMLVALVVVIALGGAYYKYVREQRAYFGSRDLRLLATAGKQLDAALQATDSFVGNYGGSRTTAMAYLRTAANRDEKSTDDPSSYLPGFDAASRQCKLVSGMLDAGPTFTRTLDAKGVLQISYAAVRTPPPIVAPPNASVNHAWTTWSETTSGATATSHLPPDPCAGVQSQVVETASASITLAAIVRPIFQQSLFSAFEDVMLARGDGSVIFTEHEYESTTLARQSEEETTAEQVVSNLGDLMEQPGWREPLKRLDMRTLRGATRLSEVETSGGTYYLFTQPLSTMEVDRDLGSAAKEAPRWIVAGLVSKQRFMYEVLTVSTSVVLIVTALLLGIICAWPYLRLSLIGPHQRLTLADFLLLGFAALIHASILTLFVLDVLAYRSLRAVADTQLDVFASRIEGDLYHDISGASQALRDIDAWAKTARDVWQNGPIQTSGVTLPGLTFQKFPYITAVAWIDDQGRQRYKLTMHEALPLVNVGHRSYFRDALAGRTYPMDKDPKSAVAIESIRSSTTGRTETDVARQSATMPGYVVAAGLDLVHIAHAVLPPSFGFAIIDDTGKVLFHSEASRNNEENFFAETDRNRTVLSAVFARHAIKTNVRYWGADHRVLVQPLSRLPWTLIVFRDKSLLRTVNTEAVAMTLAMLLGNASIYLLLIVLVLSWRPGYRAPQAWPLEKNAPLYWRLVVLYLLTTAAAWVTHYAFDARSVLQITMLIPPHAFAGTVLILQRRRKVMRWRAALAIWIVITLTWVWVLRNATMMRGTQIAHHLAWARAAALLVLAAIAFATFIGREQKCDWRRYSRAYISAAVLLLIVAAALPTIGFFKVASRLEIEGLAKYSQLQVAQRVEDAIIATETANNNADESVEKYCEDWGGDRSRTGDPSCTGDPSRIGDPFSMLWMIMPMTKICHAQLCAKKFESIVPGSDQDRDWLPDVYRDVLPAYSEASVSLRQLHGAPAAGAGWNWSWSADRLTLTKDLHLPSENAVSTKVFHKDAGPSAILVQSRVPLSFAEAWRYGEGFTSRTAVWAALFLISVAAVIGVLVLIVRFIARKLFLMDIREPFWLKPPPPLKPTLGDHVFLICSGDARKLTRPPEGEADRFIDVSIADLADNDSWDAKLLEVDHEAEGKNVRIDDLDYDIGNAYISLRKLTLLERLLALPNRVIVVASRTTPNALVAMLPEGDLQARWKRVLESFIIVTESQLEMAPEVDEPQNERDDAAWLDRETRQGAFLRDLRKELDPLVNHAERQQLIDEVLERSSAYYASLWASCSRPEKILLNQLAREGVLNGNDRRSVRRLLARGLVRRAPNLRLFNDTFRLYVLGISDRENVPLDAQDGGSAWDAVRLPIFVVIVSVVIIIFATQKDLMNVTTGLAAALTTGLPAIARLFGLFTERRTAAAAEK